MSRDEALLNQLKQAVLDNLENDQFSVEQLSQIVGVSRSHLHRKLKKLKGQSISQFIREVRLTKALELLRKDVATSSEIAYRVGFNSPSYFHKCFSDYFGYPPSEAKSAFHNQSQSETLEHHTDLEKHDEAGNIVASSATVIKNGGHPGSGLYLGIAFTIIAFVFLGYWVLDFSAKKQTEAAEPDKSIAVLPFQNLSEDKGNQHFADGLVFDLLSRLALISEFKVISQTSSDTYRKRGLKKTSEIAEDLGVSYIVEGSVQKFENNARITIQLIDATNDVHIWSKPFDRNLADIFEVQSEIAILVASELSDVLTEEQTSVIQRSPTENVKAWESYQLGRHHWSKRTHRSLETSIGYFEDAIEEDPTFALAVANLADAHFLLSFHLAAERETRIEKAKALALASLELGHHVPEAYNVLGGIYSFRELDWAAAEQSFVRGLKYNPNHANLHHRYSEHLAITGRHREARRHINRAIELDPLFYVIRIISAHLYYSQGLFKEALTEIEICHELIADKYHPRITHLTFLVLLHLADGQTTLEYLNQWEEMNDRSGQSPDWNSIYTQSGMDGVLRQLAEASSQPLMKAIFYSLCGEANLALDCLLLRST